jgi:hypothetical protein
VAWPGRGWTLRDLAARTREALVDDPRQREVFSDNVRLGAAVELVVDQLRSG